MKPRKTSDCTLKIISISKEPVESVPYITVALGSNEIQYEQFPIYMGEMSGLPDEVDALIVASDLQGVTITDSSTNANPKLLGEELAEILALLLQYDKQEGETKLKSTPGVKLFSEPESIVYAGITFAGIGGVIGRGDKANRTPESEFLRTLDRLLHKAPDVLLLHQGPDVPAKNLIGHAGIREQIEAGPPILVCCGHVHWEEPLAEFDNGSQILNADCRVFVFTPSRNES